MNNLKKTKAILQYLIENKKNAPTNKNDSPYLEWVDVINKNKAVTNIDENALKFLEKSLNVKLEYITKNDDTYTAIVHMDNINFQLNFTVLNENDSYDTIKYISVDQLDIESHFINEIKPCINFCIKNDNLQLLLLNTVEYNNKFNERLSLLEGLKEQKFITIKDDYQFQDGGLLLFIHYSDVNTLYCKCQWSLIFSEQSLTMKHYFKFENVDIDDFVENNENILEKFNTSTNLLQLQLSWKQLLRIIKNDNKKQ